MTTTQKTDRTGKKSWRLYPFNDTALVVSLKKPRDEWREPLERWLPDYQWPDEPDRAVLERVLMAEPFNLRPADFYGYTLPMDRVVALLDSVSVARPTETDAATDDGENKGDKVAAGASGRLSVRDLAELHGLDDHKADALRGRLGRWRPSHCNGEWIEVSRSYRRPNTPKYLYDPDAIRPIIEAVKARPTQTSNERPAAGN